MTVRDLIARLAELPQDVPVVCHFHSEYGEVRSANTLHLVENGGYYSTPYNPVDELRARLVVEVD